MKALRATILFNKRTAFRILVTGALTVILSGTLVAQDRFSIHFRPGVSIATSDLGSADLNTGFGFEGSLSYRIMPHASAYGGWGWNRFSSDESFAGPNIDFEETGYTFGLQFMRPFQKDIPIEYYLRAGGVVNHIEVENEKGDIVADSGHGLGFQAEIGVALALCKHWKIVPGIKYQSLLRDLTIEGATYAADLNYLSGGLGILYTF